MREENLKFVNLVLFIYTHQLFGVRAGDKKADVQLRKAVVTVISETLEQL